ncbi:MAG: sulfatase [Bacteroidales bacterium]|nr:sulfatase [Bacteroidales bacterium]
MFILLLLFPGTHFGQGTDKMNILFIAVDDLKPVLGCYGDTLVHSPNIDAIAGEGMTFTRNYCQQAVCAPSRVSLMTSRYPDQTRVWDLETRMRNMDPGIVSLPQYLRQYGYRTAATGKIFDSRSVDEQRDSPSWSIPWGKPWDIRYYSPVTGKPSYFYASTKAKDTIALLQAEAVQLGVDQQTYVRERYFPPFESAKVPVDAYVDGAIAKVGIELMEQLAASGDPFFLGIGFNRPHLPFNAPTQFWDLYNREDFSLAPFRQQATGSPSIAYHTSGELRSYTGIPATGEVPDGTQLELIHGYYAAISWIDHLVGQVMERLNELGLADNTIIVLWGDHGWHLGEKRHWSKSTLWEESTRAPLMIMAPGFKSGRCSTPVSFLDIYPTLVELAGLEANPDLEGISLVPMMKNTNAERERPALTTHGKGNHSLRTKRWRYTVYNDGGEELYDHENDVMEWNNLADDPDYSEVKEQLKKWLPKKNAEDVYVLQWPEEERKFWEVTLKAAERYHGKSVYPEGWDDEN